MLKHGRAGVPMEVMGLMLGEFIDDYTAAWHGATIPFSAPAKPVYVADIDKQRYQQPLISA